MRVTVLGSGSGGNATLVESADGCILVDAGFSGRDLERRLAAVEVDPAGIAALVITHDHGDHTRGMGVLARRFGIPLYVTERTHLACAALLSGVEDVRRYESSRPFRIVSLEVRPFLTVHDAADPVAVTVTDVSSGARLGIATDLGRPTAAVRTELAGCNMLVLEANHDDALLWAGPYPWSVKQRIASSHGHLSNRAAAELARELYPPRPRRRGAGAPERALQQRRAGRRGGGWRAGAAPLPGHARSRTAGPAHGARHGPRGSAGPARPHPVAALPVRAPRRARPTGRTPAAGRCRTPRP
jgi:phosphoribosyl 1,2-cyclic phosphodiesterase